MAVVPVASSASAGADLAAENEDLAAENERLRLEVARLQALVPNVSVSSAPILTSAVPTVLVNGVAVKQDAYEVFCFAGALFCMVVLWAIPFMKPFNRCCETRLYKVFPLITLVNLGIFVVTLHRLHTVSFNDLFFSSVEILEIVIAQVEAVLLGCAGFLVLLVLWKFKDRLLEVLGVENAKHLIGEFRDWATCWSMRRFHPIELFIWKVDGLACSKLHSHNDLFCEVSLGYNVNLRTRVHHRAGNGCIMKESIQLNFDPYDTEGRLSLVVKNQDVINSTEICSIQLGVGQIQRLQEQFSADGYLGWGASQTSEAVTAAWAPSRFLGMDLIPSGKIYVRFSPVEQDEDAGFFSCCCPRRAQQQRLR